MEIGAQLFTIRSFCKNLSDFSESLKRVADIGYKTIQVSGTCEYDARWLKEQLDSNGLRCVLTHTAPAKLADVGQTAAAHDILDCRYVGLGHFPFNTENTGEGYEDYLRLYRPIAAGLRSAGKYFMYHNHAHEFSRLNGRLVMERIAEDFSPEELGFTLDTYWVQAGGGDPAQWLEKLSGRVPCIHLKDFAYDRVMAVLGEGNINFDRIFNKAEESGTRFMLVEQDNCNGENPFDCLRRSYDYLRARGFE